MRASYTSLGMDGSTVGSPKSGSSTSRSATSVMCENQRREPDARGVADDAEAERAHSARTVDDGAPELSSPLGARLDILHLNVDQPLSGNVRVRAPGVADPRHRCLGAGRQHVEVVVVAHAQGRWLPAHDVAVEIADSWSILHREVGPDDSTLEVSARSLPLLSRDPRGCRVPGKRAAFYSAAHRRSNVVRLKARRARNRSECGGRAPPPAGSRVRESHSRYSWNESLRLSRILLRASTSSGVVGRSLSRSSGSARFELMETLH